MSLGNTYLFFLHAVALLHSHCTQALRVNDIDKHCRLHVLSALSASLLKII